MECSLLVTGGSEHAQSAGGLRYLREGNRSELPLVLQLCSV